MNAIIPMKYAVLDESRQVIATTATRWTAERLIEGIKAHDSPTSEIGSWSIGPLHEISMKKPAPPNERQSDVVMRTLLALEIWRYNECPWDFDNPPEGMAQLQKQIALDQAESLVAVVLGSAVFKAKFANAS